MSIKKYNHFLIISFLLLSVYQINAEFIYIGNFEDETSDESPNGWIPYTDDDVTENGWKVKGGTVVQTIINGDQTKGGARLLLKDNLLNLMDAKHPTTTTLCLDVYPLDYKEGSGDVWFGMGFMADAGKPIERSLIDLREIALQESKKCYHFFLLAEDNYYWDSQKKEAEK